MAWPPNERLDMDSLECAIVRRGICRAEEKITLQLQDNVAERGFLRLFRVAEIGQPNGVAVSYLTALGAGLQGSTRSP